MAGQLKATSKNKDNSPSLFFRVSSGLKRIIGRDLIISDFVAVFELVKNSFDAHAKNVNIVVDDGCIWIIDNGKGMSYADIIQKWLFVAYSAKQDGVEDKDYRGQKHSAGVFAGNKGVGRFSCDRLGAALTLQTKSIDATKVEVINVNWDEFENDSKEEFINIPVTHSTTKTFELPDGFNVKDSGTVLKINWIRDSWDRDKLLELRAHLTKLINPFDGKNKSFKVSLHANAEKAGDKKVKDKIKEAEAKADAEDQGKLIRQIVNGPIENFIFSDLESKTTKLEVSFSSDGKSLVCMLIDRGTLIYSIKEKNPFPLLAQADFTCKLFYLNQSAKQTFSRRMGVPSVQFGSVFLFRNGFRVFPIGVEGDDTFGIDRRKQQGYARYLGTRELIGRIDVHGGEYLFREASSRDQGLIDTPAYRELLVCFREKCLKRLEKYVTDVTWKDALDKMREDSSGLHSAPARARIIELVSELVGTGQISLLDYSKDIVDILSDKVEQFEGSLNDLRRFAKSVGDSGLAKRINAAEKRFKELRDAEARATQVAEREREARKEAEQRTKAAEEARIAAESEKETAQRALEEEKKRTLFLTSVNSLDVETVTNLHHQVIICAADIDALIELQIDKLQSGETIDKESMFSFLERMRFKNQQVLAIARMATKANFRMESDEITDDIAAFFAQYLQNIASIYHRVQINVVVPEKSFVTLFKPIEVSIIIDNMVSNARKAGSPSVDVTFKWKSNSVLQVLFTDHGKGLDTIFSDPNHMFEKGVSTTEGSGLGLYHTRQIIESMGGTIDYDKPDGRGARFIITLPKSK